MNANAIVLSLQSGVHRVLTTPGFWIIVFFAVTATLIQLRGRVRLKLKRQVFDQSTFASPYNLLMYAFSAAPTTPYVDVGEFPDLKPLADNWKLLRDEGLKLFDEGHIKAAEKHNDAGFRTFFRTGWKRFYLKWYDDLLPSAKALCPRATELVNTIPSLNAAMYALLPPGARLGAHRDPFAASLRYHLGLVTPNSPECYIAVDGDRYHWKDGEAVIFDETFIHWAENKTDQTRVILFADVERPLTSRIVAKVNHWYKNTVIRASQTENMEGDRVGLLNRIFSFAYYLRLPGKALKRKSRLAYYTVKWLLVGGLLYLLVAY